jgi:hypothetical protein
MSPRLRSAVVTALLAMCASAPAMAEPLAYAAGFDALYRIDLATGRTTKIGAFGFAGPGALIADVEGIAFAPDGTLYGVSDSQKLLLRINKETGAATPVNRLNENGTNVATNINYDFGLAFTCDGRMWASSDRTSLLWEVNPSNASMRRVGTMGAAVSGLAGRANALFGVGVTNGGAFYSIDRDTAQLTQIGPGFARGLEGAGADFNADGTLWSVFYLDSTRPISEIYKIDPITGAASMISLVDFEIDGDDVEVETLAFGPPPCGTGGPQGFVPEPIPATSTWQLLLTAAGLFATALFALRNRVPARVRRTVDRRSAASVRPRVR